MSSDTPAPVPEDEPTPAMPEDTPAPAPETAEPEAPKPESD